MPQVDFYILADPRPDARERLACRLAETAYKRGKRVYLNAGDPAQAGRLEQLLWTFRDGAFVPHAAYPAAADEPAPVLIGHGVDPRGEEQVLINLAGEVPPFHDRFQRVLEPVAGGEEEKRAARQRFRAYKERGYTLESHNL